MELFSVISFLTEDGGGPEKLFAWVIINMPALISLAYFYIKIKSQIEKIRLTYVTEDNLEKIRNRDKEYIIKPIIDRQDKLEERISKDIEGVRGVLQSMQTDILVSLQRRVDDRNK